MRDGITGRLNGGRFDFVEACGLLKRDVAWERVCEC